MPMLPPELMICGHGCVLTGQPEGWLLLVGFVGSALAQVGLFGLKGLVCAVAGLLAVYESCMSCSARANSRYEFAVEDERITACHDVGPPSGRVPILAPVSLSYQTDAVGS